LPKNQNQNTTREKKKKKGRNKGENKSIQNAAQGQAFLYANIAAHKKITRQTTIASTSVSQGTIRKMNISPNKGSHSLQILSVTKEQNPSAAQTDCRANCNRFNRCLSMYRDRN
jgi:hypothetical protein